MSTTTVAPYGVTVTVTASVPTLVTTSPPATAALTITAAAPTVAISTRLTITGGTPTVTADTTVSPGPAAPGIVGGLPTVITPILPVSGLVSIAYSAPTVSAPFTVKPTAASISVTGSAPTITARGDIRITPGPAMAHITTDRPAVDATQTSAPPLPQAPFSPDLPPINAQWTWDWPSAHGGTTWGSHGCLRTVRPGLITIYAIGGIWEAAPGFAMEHQNVLVPASVLAQITAQTNVDRDTGYVTYGAENIVDWDNFEVVYVNWPGYLFPLGYSVAEGVALLTEMINATPGQFVLMGFSGGAAVASNVYDSLRSGELAARNSDLLMGWCEGNPRRQTGREFPSAPAGYGTGGYGCTPTPLNGTEARWWEWSLGAGSYSAYDEVGTGVTYDITDPVSCLGNTTAEQRATRELVAETWSAMVLDPDQEMDLLGRAQELETLWAALVTAPNTSPHKSSIYVVQPFLGSGDHRTYWQLSWDAINDLAVGSPPAPVRHLREFAYYTVKSGDMITAGCSVQWINLHNLAGPQIFVGVNFRDSNDALIATSSSLLDTNGAVLISATAPTASVLDPAADSDWRGLQAGFTAPPTAVKACLVIDAEPTAMRTGIVWFSDPVFGSQWSPGEADMLARYEDELWHGDAQQAAHAAEELTKLANPDPEWIITVYDKFWRRIGEIGDYIECSGSDPRNNVPTATLKLKGNDPYIPIFQTCRTTMVGVTMETAGQRYAFYTDKFTYEFKDGMWTGTAELLGIWDILNYLMIWPLWFLPIQTQILSHAIYIGPIVSCLRVMIWEQALRIQFGINEFFNNALSLNLDFRTWFATWILSNFNIFEMLKCPVYVALTSEPPLIAPIVGFFTDTSPLICRTVRMESCGAVIRDMVEPYGVDVRVDLWLPGDEQPDMWTKMNPIFALDQPTYVVTVTDRSQITGPTGTVLDSVIRTVVDLSESMLGGLLDPILNPNPPPGLPQGFRIAPVLGVDWIPPWVLLIAPEPGDKGSIETCKIVDHTPKGWQHIIGGRSPKWLNDLFNVFFSWIIDAISILIGFTGIPSDMLSGFMQNAFLAFQLWEHFNRRVEVGPYHPAIEVFHATSSAPYNIETIFGFINAFWDSRGWTCVQATFRNGEVYTLGKDVFRGALVSIAYNNRQTLYTDFVDNVFWRIDKDTRDLMIQVGDGKSIESPLAKHQRFISGLLEAVNVATLAPQSGGLI